MRYPLLSRIIAPLFALASLGVFHSLWAAVQPNIFVTEQVLVSSTRFSRDLTDFTYRIRLTNQGGALTGARAIVRSVSANTVILDNEVVLGNVAAGTTFTSSDTFTLRQNRLVPFNPANLIWIVDAERANTRPVANAGVDQTVRTGLTVSLDGTASTDADSDTLTYRWTMTSRPAGSSAALSSASLGRPSVVIDRGGTYVFSLVVNDGRIDSLADEVRISTSNSTPVANAGADRTVARASRVTLDGSASRDPDFDALGFAWVIAGAPTGSTAVLSDPTAMNPSITLDRPGTYTFRLTVTDGALTSPPDTVVISTENSAPVANAGIDQTARVGALITLDGSSSSDADNDPLSLIWSWVSRPDGSASALDTSNSLRPFFTADRTGLYVAQLIVNDGLSDSAPDTVTVTIEVPPNNRPSAVNDAASTAAGVAVTIDVLANDSDPDPATALSISAFTQPPAGGTVVQTAGGLRFTPAAGFAGTANFQYTISDGELTATAFVSVIVSAPANQRPLVSAGADQSVTLSAAGAASITLNGAVSDDGLPAPANLTSAWSRTSGPGTVTFSAPGAATTTASFTVAGTYVLRLTASDGALSSSDELQITVAPPANTAPTLNPISDRSIAVGSTLQLQLLATDPDSPETLTFSMGAAPAGATFSAPSFVSWTPGNAQTGTFAFTVSVRDVAGASASRSFNVTVTGGNRPPVFAGLTSDTINAFAPYTKTVTATDPDGDAVTLSLLEGPAGLALNGNVFGWVPGAAQVGRFTVKLRATDSRGAFTAGLFQITVNAVLRPIAHDDSYPVVAGESITISAPGVLQNDVSPNGAPLSALRRSDPALGSLSAFSADGSFTYTAPATDPKPPFNIIGRQIVGTAGLRPPNGGSPMLGDLNQDGLPDLVYFGYAGPTLVATALSGGTGQALFSDIGGLDANFCENNLGSYPGYVLGDIEDDGQIELVTVTGCRSGESGYQRLAAFRPDGSRKWVSPLLTQPFFDLHCPIGGCAPGTVPTRTDYSVLFESTLSVARLAANEAPVIMARAEIPATAGQVYTELSPGVYGYKDYGCRIVTGVESDMGQACNVTLLLSGTDGHVLQVLRAPLRQQFNRGIPISPFQRNPPIAADLDGDGAVEIISGADVWRRVGSTWALAWQGGAEPEQVAVADLDGDGRQEVIWALDRNQNLAAGTPYLGFDGILIFDANGQELRRIPLPSVFPGMMTIADVDGDRTPEILITEAGNLHVIGTDGSYKWTYFVPDNPAFPQPAGFRTSYHNNVVVYDLDGDGNTEVIFSSSTGLHILDGRSGAQKALFGMGPRYSNISASNTTFFTDWDDDGHADIVSFGEVGGSPTEAFAYVISAANDDWLPAAKIHNQAAFQPTGINEAGRVLFDPSIARSYRNPRQLGTVRDPRETAGTSFEYAVNDGVTDSANARVFLEIRPLNSPPVFTSRPPTAIQAEGATSTVIYQATAADPDAGDTVTYSLNATGSNGAVGPSPFIDINAATGAVSIVQSTSFGNFSWRVTLTATDSQGASTTQTFVARHEARARISVPNVVGTSLLSATQTLTAADLQSTVLQEQYGALPAGQVMAQNPVASSAQTRGATVLLTVSRGPAPTVVPNLLGRTQASATTALTAAGFTATVTRAFSDTVAAGRVASQSVAAGSEQAGGSVGIVISAGTGLELQLARSVTPSNEPIAFTLVARDVNGNVLATPAVTISIAADGITAGALPTLTGGTITPALNSRGRYRLSITDGARTSSAQFLIAQPNLATKPTQIAKFARLEAVLGTMNTLLREADAARLAGDTPLMTARMVDWVNTWRTIDLNRLSTAVPFSPEGGFPLEVGDLAARGITQTPDDVLNLQILRDANADLLEIEEALRDPTTPYQQVITLFRSFNARAERIRSVSPGKYGVVDAKGDYAVLLAHTLPRAMDALVEDVAQVFGLPPRARRYPQLSQNVPGSRWAQPMLASTAALPTGTAMVNSTLAEELATTTIQAIVDGIDVYTVKDYYTNAFSSVMYSGLIMGIAQEVRTAVGGADPFLTVTTGSSLSINVFHAAYSTIEGLGLNGRHPSLNRVMVIGPALPAAFKDAIEKVKGLGGAPSTAAGVARARDLDEFEQGLDDLQKQADELYDAGQNVFNALSNAYQDPSERSAVSDCLFISGPLCKSIRYINGFISVYEPLGLNLPTPILFVAVNMETGETLVGTPAFIPAGNDP